MSVATVSQKGWVVIPAVLRRKYHWKPGDQIKVVDFGMGVSLVPVLRHPEDEAMGFLKRSPGGRRGSLTKALEQERAKERRRERRSR
jgi:AbrB family looped-hinge helix DNA binding protein